MQESEPNVEALLAAISFHDAWAYIMHNAAEDALPNIDETLPRLNSSSPPMGGNSPSPASPSDDIQAKYGCCTRPSSVATDPINQMWMQGSPPVFLNNEANMVSRSLDAFACAVRTCCDQANSQFEDMAKASGMDMACMAGNGGGGGGASGPTATTTAVMANENELCSRNIVLSAKTLLDQHSVMTGEKSKKHGLNMVAHAMMAFLENSQADQQQQQQGNNGGGDGGNVGMFTDGQIKNLLAACDIVIQHPLLLHSPGPLYHMASNAAILLCHLLNGIYSNCNSNAAKTNEEGGDAGGGGSPMNNNKVESILFDEVLDTFMAMRKVLNIHRKSLPVKLRCHGIPRPLGLGPFSSSNDNNPQSSFIELADTLMCQCRGCQGFVLMGCSPCVAAERSMKTAREAESQDAQLEEVNNGVEQGLNFMDDLHMDDDALLDILSRIIQN